MQIIKLKMPLGGIVQKELDRTKAELGKFRDELEIFELFKAENDTIIPGARVKNSITGVTGRVLSCSNDSCFVQWQYVDAIKNRTVKLEHLINLSLGYEGFLESRVWILGRNIQTYEDIVNKAKVPAILLEDQYNIIEITDVKVDKYGCMAITFTLANNLRSGKLVIPIPETGRLLEKGYYEVETDNRDVIKIIKTSNIAFQSVIGTFRPF